MTRKFDENAIAEVIVSVLPAGVAREFSSERDTIRYAVRGEGIKLRKIVLNRDSFRKLVDDPAGPVKIEYLQRELLAAATQRGDFRYPRPLLHVAARRKLQFALPVAVGR